MSLALHNEARGSSYYTKVLVASVIMERLLSKLYGDKVCDVVFYPNAFSGITRKITINDRDRKSYLESKRIAYEILTHRVIRIRGIKYFNDKQLGRRYKTKTLLIKSDNLVFY
jgi:hypothetical protein